MRSELGGSLGGFFLICLVVILLARYFRFSFIVSGHTRASKSPMGSLTGRPCLRLLGEFWVASSDGWRGHFFAPSVIGWLVVHSVLGGLAWDGTCNIGSPSRCLHKSVSCARLFGTVCRILFFLPKQTSFLSLRTPRMEGVP